MLRVDNTLNIQATGGPQARGYVGYEIRFSGISSRFSVANIHLFSRSAQQSSPRGADTDAKLIYLWMYCTQWLEHPEVPLQGPCP